ncbi:MAG: YfhO family protein [Bacteroidaceae bacterium]|nr:YfhO family protein [Bacteroidaceae bacterium]
MNKLKSFLPDIIAVAAFVLISLVYFFPADIEGRILNQHDAGAGIGAGQEVAEYHERTGKETRWTNALFGGMPTYQISPSYNSSAVVRVAKDVYHLFLMNYVQFVFIYLLGFYILMRAFDFKAWMSALGAIMWAFSSYFFIIIAAGHIWKVLTLAYIPPTIAGMVLCYRGKYLWGCIVTAVFAAFQISSNHVQMTYYFLFPMAFMWIAYLVQAVKNKKMADFAKGTGALALGALLAVSVNLSNLYHTYEYSKETMRGASELTQKTHNNPGDQTSTGLGRDYITQWSYGIEETWTLMIPNAKGGASVPLVQNKTAMTKADNEFYSIYQQVTQYWGEQPMTSGPVYVGAFVCMLFILGLIIVKGPMKWALLAATVLSVLLSWGRNFMDFTDLFIDYMPMYAKFRTVSSILVVAEFTIPLLAMFALKRVVEICGEINEGGANAADLKKKLLRNIAISFALTGGFCLLFAIAPGIMSTPIASQEATAINNGLGEMAGAVTSNLIEMRTAMLTADCWRSFWIIAVCTILLVGYIYKVMNLSAKWMVGIILVITLFDMWAVNKRYLYDEMFKPEYERTEAYQITETDKQILADKTLDYRVLNFAGSTFNENTTSYFHKSIGGYHAAKMRRYQDMIDYHIQSEMGKLYKLVANANGDMTKIDGSQFPVINMLNTRYFIFPIQGGTVPVKNEYANGNAWFVNKLVYVDTADDEIGALGKVSPATTAVVNKEFASLLKEGGSTFELPLAQASAAEVTLKTAAAEANPVPDSLKTYSAAPLTNTSIGTVKMISYEPNALEYETNSEKGGVVVFSENYYPGWTAKIDGKEVEIARANYILRALQVPAGKHKIEMTFEPSSIDTTETVAYAAMALIALMVCGGIFVQYRKKD